MKISYIIVLTMSSINKMPKDRNCLLDLDALISCFIVICFTFLLTLITLFSAFYIKKNRHSATILTGM